MTAALVGALLPKGHVATRVARLGRAPDEVWTIISAPERYPEWRSDVQRVEPLDAGAGQSGWVEIDRRGQRLPLEIVSSEPPRRLVVRIAGPKLPFGGTWTYTLEPDGIGSKLTLVENGEVYNPIFRLVSKFMDPRATIDRYLRALATKLGEEPRFED